MKTYSLPTVTKDSLQLYVESRCHPGGFLFAVLSNDLMGAMDRADDHNREALFEICQFIYNELPNGCHGSPMAVARWLKGEK